MNWTINQTVDLSRGYTPVVWPDALMVSGDVGAHTWRLTVLDNGNPVDLSGATITGSFLRADGNTVTVAGSASGNVAMVTLTDVCYAVEGKMKATIKMVKAGATITLAAVIFTVGLFTSGSVIDPGVAYADFQIDASPAGTYADLAALISADPDHSKIYITLDDGAWCYHNGTAFVAGGVYIATPIADGQITPRLTSFGVLGKNLFNSATATIGYYVRYQDGDTVSYAGLFVSDYIAVEPYHIYAKTDGEQLAYYDSGKAYVSGLASVPGGIFVVPSGVAFVRFSGLMENIAVYQLEMNDAKTAYEPYAFYIDPADFDGQPLVKSRNLFDAAAVTAGKYISYSTGLAVPLSTYSASNYIHVTPGSAFTLSNQSTYVEQFAYYDADLVYVSGEVNTGVTSPHTFTVPAGCYFVRLSVKNSDLDSLMMVDGSTALDYESFGEYILDGASIRHGSIPVEALEGVEDVVSYITVTVGTGKDYTSLRTALEACTGGTASKQYIVEFYGGGVDYDVSEDITEGEIAGGTYIGLTIPSYTTLRGIGNREDNVLTLTLSTPNTVISTINLWGSSSMENMTVYGNKCRYAVHDDYNDGADKEKTITNCRIKAVDCAYHATYGAGYRSGAKWTFTDCVFDMNLAYAAFSAHNNVSFTEPAELSFVNCRFITAGTHGAKFGSLNTNANGIINRLRFIGCKTNGILLHEESAGVYGAGILVELTGYANDVTTATITNTDEVDYSDRVDLI